MKVHVEQLENGAKLPPTPSTASFATVLKSSTNKAELHHEVRTVLRDTDRRARNIIISGVVPVQGQADHVTVKKLFENHLSVKPRVDRPNCKRIGKPVSGAPLRLLVTLNSSDDVTNILKVARDLRRAADPRITSSVFINKDMSPEESKLAYELRVKRRTERVAQSGSGNSLPPTIVTTSTTLEENTSSSSLSASASSFVAPTPSMSAESSSSTKLISKGKH